MWEVRKRIIGLKEFLENLLGCSVDVVRKHRNNNEFLLKQIEKDGIDIIREPANQQGARAFEECYSLL